MKLKIEKGTPITELVKGSLDYTMHLIRKAFYKQFRDSSDDWDYYLYIEEFFSDYVIVKAEGLAVDEYYLVKYTIDAEGHYVFTAREEWEVVELAYRPKSGEGAAASGEMAESALAKAGNKQRGKGKRLQEMIDHAAELQEAQAGNKARVITGRLAQADVVNNNSRRYRRAVLREAVEEATTHLHETLSQGRFLLLGEETHPKHKGQAPRLLETIVVWKRIWLDEVDGWVKVSGEMIQNSNGKDAIVTMDAGVLPGLSLRGYGEHEMVKENGQEIEEILWLRLTGVDLVMTPGFENAGIEQIEAMEESAMKDKDKPAGDGQDTQVTTQAAAAAAATAAATGVNLEEVREQAKQDLLRQQQIEEADKRLKAAELAEANLRQQLGIGVTDDLAKAIAERNGRLEKLEADERKRAVQAHVAGELKKLSYPEAVMESMQQYVGEPATVEAADTLIESGRKIFDRMAAELRLSKMGYGQPGGGPAMSVRSVFEAESGMPEYARAAFEISESLVKSGHFKSREKKAQNNSRAAVFTRKYLERFDQVHQHRLAREAREYQEAMLTTQLNLPYSVLRAIIDEAFPELVAASIFDTDVVALNPIRVFYEANFTGETGYEIAVSNEELTSDLDAWVSLANKMIAPGTVNLTSDGGGTTYVEGVDYVMDYINGRVMALDAGSMVDATTHDIDYTYHAIRKGENAEIERGRAGLSYDDLALTANRLATEISSETIVFSQSQLGFDAVGRTINLLMKEIRRRVNKGLLANALGAALRITSNSGGTWTSATDPLSELFEKIGVAKVKVENRYYEPTFIVMSKTNADVMSNSDFFTAAGDRPDADLNEAGYVGRAKGLPVFGTTEFRDNHILVGNRELLMYRTMGGMTLKGPYPTYGSNRELIANEQYYSEEYDGFITPIPEKGSYVVVA